MHMRRLPEPPEPPGESRNFSSSEVQLAMTETSIEGSLTGSVSPGKHLPSRCLAGTTPPGFQTSFLASYLRPKTQLSVPPRRPHPEHSERTGVTRIRSAVQTA